MPLPTLESQGNNLLLESEIEMPPGVQREVRHYYTDLGYISKYWCRGEGFFTLLIRINQWWQFPGAGPSQFIYTYWQRPWPIPCYIRYSLDDNYEDVDEGDREVVEEGLVSLSVLGCNICLF